MVDKINDTLNPFLAVRMDEVRYIVNGYEWLTKAEIMGFFFERRVVVMMNIVQFVTPGTNR